MRSVGAVCAAFAVGMASLVAVNRTSAEQRVPAAKDRRTSPTRQDVEPGRVIGKWYMGTMTGVDCNVSVNADRTLTVQWGGCFHQDPVIKATWKISADKITWSDATLKKRLGPHLSVVGVGKNIVLVPQSNESKVKRHGYHYEYCFWRNLMGDKGLELPKEARELDKRRR